LKTKLTLIFFLSAFFCCTLKSQTINPYFQSIVANVRYDSIYQYLHKFESLGVKEPGTAALNNTKNWLLTKYTNLGYTDITIDTFSQSGHEMYNIVVTKTGTLYPNKFVIVDGHYDTYTGTGTNDNGSGTSIILEIARVLKNITTEYSVRFIHFSAEELGTVGSDHYVNNIVGPQNMQIRLVFNIDEVGGVAGYSNDTIKCESDQSNPSSNNVTSAAFTDSLRTLTQLYSNLKTKLSNAYGSDYVPFQQNGEIITGYYENRASNYVHSANDFLSHVDTSYVYQIAKAATGATLFFARAYDVSVGMTENDVVSERISVFPNPFNDKIFICPNNTSDYYTFVLYNENGEKILQQQFINQNIVDLSFLRSTLYFYMIYDKKGVIINSGKVFKGIN
jgi:Zn-dependent M28 family amino/carboxypeptidase